MNSNGIYESEEYYSVGYSADFLCANFHAFRPRLGSVRKMLDSWKDCKESSNVFQVYLTSIRSLRVRIASLYYADYTLIITILSVMVSNSGGLIVAYKDVRQLVQFRFLMRFRRPTAELLLL